ncbi:Histidine--tRNA ligase, cytoplasmic [Glycine soja]|uniref:Histidine--tRNA ligase, cytoplasmic n=1 Tax=Glycine soja TaxID=3848 RepID=A0A445INW6_GLYSO|nr:Histidine--tRNA ligase, cytoplasmic [Glycine soja]
MFGSIASGGRYDNLMEMFGSKKVTTIGVSLGIERVFEIMEQRQKDQNQMARPTKIKVLVSILEMEDDLILVAELAGELWDAGVKAEFFLNKSTLSMQTNQGSLGWYLLVSGK